MSRRFLARVSLIAFALLLWLPAGDGTAATPSQPANTQWVPAREIALGISSWFPDIAMDSAGTTHIVWNASEANTPTLPQGETLEQPTIRDYLMYQSFGANGQSRPTDIGLARGGEAIRNAIAVDRDGSLDALYRSGGAIWFIKAPINEAARAGAWSEPRRVSGTEGAYYAAIAQDSAGTLHIAYTENVPIDAGVVGVVLRRESLFYRRSADGGVTWSAPVRLSSVTSRLGATRPQVRVSGTAVTVAWDQGYDNINAVGNPTQGAIRRSLDGGMTWQQIQIVADADGPIEQVTFAFGADRRALLVWRETAKDVFRFSASGDAGATWSDPATVPNIAPRPYLLKHQFDRYAVAADRDGIFHLLAVGQVGVPDQLALLHLELHDGVWSAPQTVYAGHGLPEYPGIAMDGGNRIVVSFFVRDSLFQLGDYRVWRVEGTTATAPAAPKPVPTVAPKATTASALATAPAIGPKATVPPGTIELAQRPSIDRPPHGISYAIGMLAVIGLIGFVVVARLWWVRRC